MPRSPHDAVSRFVVLGRVGLCRPRPFGWRWRLEDPSDWSTAIEVLDAHHLTLAGQVVPDAALQMRLFEVFSQWAQP